MDQASVAPQVSGHSWKCLGYKHSGLGMDQDLVYDSTEESDLCVISKSTDRCCPIKQTS